MTQATCRLCLTNAPNMKAHIMAEGLMKLIHGQSKYDGRFIMLSKESTKPVPRPTGSYDKNILCDKCDNLLGEYDRVAIEFCKRTDFEPHPSGVADTLSHVDQKKLKLFAMSYVWRASITTLNEYKAVCLGEKHEAKIATMLRAGNPGDVDDYSVIVSRYTLPDTRKAWGMHILNPVTNRLDDGVNLVDVYLPNLYKWKVKVDKRPFSRELRMISLGALNEVLVLNLGDYTKSAEFSIMHGMIMSDKEKRGGV